jgi:hypothetical protein
MEETTLPSLSEELKYADFGDVRLTRRLMSMIDAAESNPSGSIPERSGSEGATEAVYRFYRNERVTPELVLEPHIQCTVGRAATLPEVLVFVSKA